MKILKKIIKRVKFKLLCKKTNSKIKKNISLMGEEYIELGENVYIGKYSRLNCIDTYEKKQKLSPRIIIGRNAYIGNFFTILCGDSITIGENVLIASYVMICDLNHGSEVSSIPFVRQNIITKAVKIGNNCWIGEKVMILPGVTIGNNCIIGAGSIVTKNIPDNCIAIGNPARIVKCWNNSTSMWETYHA